MNDAHMRRITAKNATTPDVGGPTATVHWITGSALEKHEHTHE